MAQLAHAGAHGQGGVIGPFGNMWLEARASCLPAARRLCASSPRGTVPTQRVLFIVVLLPVGLLAAPQRPRSSGLCPGGPCHAHGMCVPLRQPTTISATWQGRCAPHATPGPPKHTPIHGAPPLARAAALRAPPRRPSQALPPTRPARRQRPNFRGPSRRAAPAARPPALAALHAPAPGPPRPRTPNPLHPHPRPWGAPDTPGVPLLLPGPPPLASPTPDAAHARGAPLPPLLTHPPIQVGRGRRPDLHSGQHAQQLPHRFQRLF